MNKIAIKVKVDLRYFIAIIGCAALIYWGYKWDILSAAQLNAPQSRTREIQKANAAFARGNIFYKEGKFKEAINAYHECLALQPDHEPSHISTALASTKLGNYDHALSHAQKALNLNKNNASPYVMLGQLYERKHDSSTAKKYYNAALQINPTLFEPHYFLSRIYTLEGTQESVSQAIEHGKKAINAKPHAKEGYMILADAYLMGGYPTKTRWMVGTPKNMPYPPVTLFRQEKMGDWQSVINQVEQQLKEKIRS